MENREILTEDVVNALLSENSLLATDAAYATAKVVISALEIEGWLIESPTCQHAAGGSKVNACDRPTRPGLTYCAIHGN